MNTTQKKINRHKTIRIPGLYDLKKVWNPTWFQGTLSGKRYFEGWYFKQTDASAKAVWAFIPGVSLSPGDDHSFVQAINGSTGQSWYFRYPIDAFSYSSNAFFIRIGENTFSSGSLHLNLRGNDITIEGSLAFSNMVTFNTSLFKPGIMGWYRFVPRMECYHGVVSLNHTVNGIIHINNRSIQFANGKGYIEKDWGVSMPKAWIWMHTNHFSTPGTSFMVSVARIPWMGSSFTGFLGYLLLPDSRLDFATYTGAKAVIQHSGNNQLSMLIRTKKYDIQIRASNGRTGTLIAPAAGMMKREIHESIDAEIHLRLSDKNGKPVFEDLGKQAGMEMVGDQSLLI